MLVLSITNKRKPFLIGSQALVADPSIITGEGVAGDVTFTTLNPADKSAGFALSNGDLTAILSGSGGSAVRGTQSRTTGKWYYEAELVQGGNSGAGLGLATGAVALSDISDAVSDSVMYMGGGAVFVDEVFQFNAGGPNTQFICVAYDADAHLVWVRKNSDDWNNDIDANPELGDGGLDVSGFDGPGLFPAFAGSIDGDQCNANFGQSGFIFGKPVGFLPWVGS